jgi:hypothetical protein
MKTINKNTCRMIDSVAHLTWLPSITLKFDTLSPPARDLPREKVELFLLIFSEIMNYIAGYHYMIKIFLNFYTTTNRLLVKFYLRDCIIDLSH